MARGRVHRGGQGRGEQLEESSVLRISRGHRRGGSARHPAAGQRTRRCHRNRGLTPGSQGTESASRAPRPRQKCPAAESAPQSFLGCPAEAAGDQVSANPGKKPTKTHTSACVIQKMPHPGLPSVSRSGSLTGTPTGEGTGGKNFPGSKPGLSPRHRGCQLPPRN